MEKEFEIPAGICIEAKKFIKDFLSKVDHQVYIVIAFDHLALIIIAWTYHSLVKAAEIIEKEGLIVTETNDENIVITKIHPAVKIQHDEKILLNQWIEIFESEPGQLQKFKQ